MISCFDRAANRQKLVGAVFFGWLAERIGRLRVLFVTFLAFVSMDEARDRDFG